MGVTHIPSRAIAAALALALLGVSGCGGASSATRPPPGAAPLVVAPRSPLAAGRLAAGGRAARAAAWAYLDAVSGRVPAPTAPLVAGLTARLADLAANREARSAAGPPARLVALALAPRGPRSIAATLALARHGQAPYGIEVELRLVAGRWLAVAIPAG